jgi:tetraacyldisaccharide 4'-kinase
LLFAGKQYPISPHLFGGVFIFTASELSILAINNAKIKTKKSDIISIFYFYSMPVWKYLLWPFALIWGAFAAFRNWLYDIKILNTAEFEVPVVSFGNLSMGGSGKTPHTEYFIYHFQHLFNIAVLSRGYRRSSSGFKIAQVHDNYIQVGDEPRQLKSKFPDITVAVGESRALAIPSILHQHPEVNLILLDDAYQHRSVQPALNVLLTPYSEPFWSDNLFPVGWLRESRQNFNRADIIIVTKCPKHFDIKMEKAINQSFQPLAKQKLFFTTFKYDVPYQLFQPHNRRNIDSDTSILLFSGIANGLDLNHHLNSIAKEVFWVEYNDHFNYEQRDLEELKTTFTNITASNKMIITTEKDAVRIEPYMDWVIQEKIEIYCLPVLVKFVGSNKEEFDNLVLDFIDYFKNTNGSN